MGGRSRKALHKDRWAWITELSDSRLEGYGKMSADKSFDFDGVSNIAKQALNHHAAKEYESRHGVLPKWYVK
jgi:hypothetical protein